LLRGPQTPQGERVAVLAAAALTVLARQHAANLAMAPASDPHSPWNEDDAWRMNGDGYQDVLLLHDDVETLLRVFPRHDGYRIDFADVSLRAGLSETDGEARLSLDGVVHRLRIVACGEAMTVIIGGRNHVVVPIDRLAPPRTETAGDDRLTAPIPARVSRVLVQVGDVVKKGAVLLVLEAMKMEFSLNAPIDGIVATVRHEVGDMVQEGAELLTFEAVPA
jgi:3-methylcrotonyl-CoA carboxylase alpha subunit